MGRNEPHGAPPIEQPFERAGPSTRSVHGGRPGGRGVSPPIDRSSTFVADEAAYRARAAGDPYSIPVYAREASPTVLAVEARLAALESAEGALLFASGLGALHGLLMGRLAAGDRVALALQAYGGTTALVRALAPRIGVEVVEFDVADPRGLDPFCDERLSLVLCESLSNPTMVVADVPSLAAQAHRVGAKLAVDATFVTPIGQRPLEHGADLVWHSASKYLGGHSDLIGGVLAGARRDLAPALDWRTRGGACADPQMAWLLERGLKTLALRMERHDANARALADFLRAHPRVERVHHPSCASAEQRALAGRLFDSLGGMLSFELRDGDAGAAAVCERLRLFLEAPSLGGVESLVSPPARMSHAGLSPAELAAVGIGPGCLRLSVGIEDLDDLRRDLEQALEA
jgi:methionine-gamma-lyase